MAAIGRFFASIGKEVLIAIGIWAAEKGVEKAEDAISNRRKKKRRWWRR